MRSCDEGRQQGESKKERKEGRRTRRARVDGSRRDILLAFVRSFIHSFNLVSAGCVTDRATGDSRSRLIDISSGTVGSVACVPVPLLLCMTLYRGGDRQDDCGRARQTCGKAQNDVATESCFAKVNKQNKLFCQTL